MQKMMLIGKKKFVKDLPVNVLGQDVAVDGKSQVIIFLIGVIVGLGL